LGQFNAVVGDLAGNAQKICEFYARAVKADADLLAFPELCIGGYPPEDLLLKRHFLNECSLTLDKLAADCPDKTMVVGFAESDRFNTYNSAAILQNGRVNKIYRKALLPNYGVFDEQRYFTPGTDPMVIDVGDLRVAVTICFDIWNIDWLGRFLKGAGPIQMILNISASPFHIGKLTMREGMIDRCANEFDCAVAYCNLVGGQDELIFDGRSILADSTGRVVTRAKAFEEDLILADIVPASDGTVQVRPLQARGLRAQERFSQNPAGSQRRHRLLACCRDCRRGTGRRECHRCYDAVEIQQP
jgi:NAD+ synthase (glutamine-hydrolysing)